VRPDNEDRWLVREQLGVTLLAVADGVGGQAGGEVASGAAVDTLADRFYAALASADLRSSLAAAMRDTNDAVVRAGDEQGRHGAASTLVAAAVRDRDAAIANLGDSRAYLVRGGTVRQLTADHAGERANAITRFVGDPRGVQPDVFVESLRSGDRLVLCSDGLTRHVADAEIAVHVSRAEPAAAADRLVELANERGGEDNVTVVVYRAPRSAGLFSRLATALLVVLLVMGLAAAVLAVALSRSP
jgi:PPM family protein phosphatase